MHAGMPQLPRLQVRAQFVCNMQANYMQATLTIHFNLLFENASIPRCACTETNGYFLKQRFLYGISYYNIINFNYIQTNQQRNQYTCF